LRLACAIWVVLVLVIVVKSYLFPTKQTVYPNYLNAGEHWLEGTDAYEMRRDEAGKFIPRMSSYRYSPLVSALYTPLALLSDAWGGALWRLGSFSCYALALGLFLRHVIPGGAQ